MYVRYPYPDELYHYGVKGMKWRHRKRGLQIVNARDVARKAEQERLRRQKDAHAKAELADYVRNRSRDEERKKVDQANAKSKARDNRYNLLSHIKAAGKTQRDVADAIKQLATTGTIHFDDGNGPGHSAAGAIYNQHRQAINKSIEESKKAQYEKKKKQYWGHK